jgi:hypothetical protein
MKKVIVGRKDWDAQFLSGKYFAFNDFLYHSFEFQLHTQTFRCTILLTEPGISKKNSSIVEVSFKGKEEDIFFSERVINDVIGIKRVINWFKEDIFNMLEDELNKTEFAAYRFMLMPL